MKPTILLITLEAGKPMDPVETWGVSKMSFCKETRNNFPLNHDYGRKGVGSFHVDVMKCPIICDLSMIHESMNLEKTCLKKETVRLGYNSFFMLRKVNVNVCHVRLCVFRRSFNWIVYPNWRVEGIPKEKEHRRDQHIIARSAKIKCINDFLEKPLGRCLGVLSPGAKITDMSG